MLGHELLANHTLVIVKFTLPDVYSRLMFINQVIQDLPVTVYPIGAVDVVDRFQHPIIYLPEVEEGLPGIGNHGPARDDVAGRELSKSVSCPGTLQIDRDTVKRSPEMLTDAVAS